ncbi:Cyclopropane-fatty-acyl-phospholipid synthase [Pelotomaculum schinkii]|uniref:4,4'-diaponeurosporenoate glycosyltransferase n=1 Tax=Pelotomaculum schinkii TaxID=78350 RepID=A0A4Y7R7J3_9FIRM|nr:glycosyltransferase [Pelotomaculum schinkii]TEB04611.1 Cyclopropane-fatty-acyl-phospholipid synthase [Pelotomaculum schinkii]
MKYIWDEENNLFRRAHVEAFAYSDGADVEQRLFQIIHNANDRSTFSSELIEGITDWPSEYHLSRTRHCLIRPLGMKPGEKVLELGCGCGAITRYLGEIGVEVVAVEGSISRARIAAERCRDLSNVRIFVDDLLRFETDERFDWILLVGVLEYAPVFTDEKEPAQYYLRTITHFLATEGKLVIAIENKLGLKYFNNCSEDHLGVPFVGVQDLYRSKTPRTFGRKELIQQLSDAGFPNCYFYYPFPDYKLPSVILSDDALKDPQFDEVDLIIRSHARDYSGSQYRLFDEALVFSTLSANQLFAEFSNSFLVVATLPNTVPYKSDKLAMTFAVNRIPEFSNITNFYWFDNIIHVEKEPVIPDLQRIRQSQDGFNISNIPSKAIYCHGRQLLWRLLAVRANKGNLDQVVAELRPWIIYLLQFAATDCSYEPSMVGAGERQYLRNWFIPGAYLDCITFNLIEASHGLVFIDNEWQADRNIPLGWVITRGVLHSLTIGLAPGNTIKSVADVVQGLCKSVQMFTTEAEITGWIDMEANFLSLVHGQALSDISISIYNSVSGFICLNQAVTERDIQIISLNQAVAGRDAQIISLNKDVAECNAKIINLNQAVAGRDTEIINLNQAVAGRDTQIVSLNQVIAERDAQIVSLNQAIAEYNSQITSLNQAVAEHERHIVAIYSTKSWRLTRPLRALRSVTDWLHRGKLPQCFFRNIFIAIRGEIRRYSLRGFTARVPYYLRNYRKYFALIASQPPVACGDLFSAWPQLPCDISLPPELAGVSEHINASVSIIIPTLNAGAEFGLLLRKLNMQRGIHEIEIVIVDSGSNDGTVELARANGCTVVEIAPEDFTHSYARNIGADSARSDYLLFMVQDAYPIGDYWVYGMLRYLLDHAEDKLVAVSCSEYSRSDSDMMYDSMINTHYRFLGCLEYDRIGEYINNDHMSLRANGQLSDVSCLISSKIFYGYRYRGDYAEDLDLGIRLIKDGYRVAMLASVKVIHSHNRPPYYYLKRSFVDVVFLVGMFDDFVYPCIESTSGLIAGIVSTAAHLSSWLVGFDESGSNRVLHEELGELIREWRHSFIEMHLDKRSHLGDKQLDNYIDSLAERYLVPDKLNKEAINESRRFLDNFLARLEHFNAFAEGVYGAQDFILRRMLREAVVKTFAATAGSLLGFMYMDFNQVIGVERDMAETIKSELKRGI